MADNYTAKSSFNYPKGTASCAYEGLTTIRSPYLQRARDSAQFTIPSLMLYEGASGATPSSDSYQSIGARGVKNLASKLLLALMPPNQSFFRCTLEGGAKDELIQNKEQWTMIQEALGQMERICQSSMETRAIRVTLFELLLQLIVAGNAVLSVPDKGPSCIYKLNQYVVVRQHNGTILKLIIKEQIAKAALSAAQKACLDPADIQDDHEDAEYGINQYEVCAYTCMERTDDNWKVHQEIKGKIVEGSVGAYPLNAPGFIPVRWRKVDGEHYGRAFCDEVMGDLTSVEGLTQSLVESAAALAKLIILVNPNGSVTKADLEGDNLDIIDGKAEDVTVVQANKAGDLSFAEGLSNSIEKRLELAFLLNTAVQRDAERVTAEEIRYIAQLLEDTLGGIYSIQSLELQVPLIQRVLALETRAGNIPSLPKESLKVQIVAGLEALGRSHELARLDAFVQNIAQTFGAEAVATFINVRNYLSRRATSLALDVTDLLHSQEDIDAARVAAQQTEVNKTIGPEVVKQMGNAATAGAATPQSQ